MDKLYRRCHADDKAHNVMTTGVSHARILPFMLIHIFPYVIVTRMFLS